MALIDRIDRTYAEVLSKFKGDVCSNPDADFSPYIRALAAEFVRVEKDHETRTICNLLLALYGWDADSLRRDLCALTVSGVPDHTHFSRANLLRNLYDGVLLYIDNCPNAKSMTDDSLTFQELKREHPGRVCICLPAFRDGSGRVEYWTCLRTVRSVDAARVALALLEAHGVKDAVAISTTKRITIEGDLAIKYSKVFLGTEQ